MHLKIFLKTEKNLKILSSGQISKKPKPEKNQKTHWAGFYLKRFFFKKTGF